MKSKFGLSLLFLFLSTTIWAQSATVTGVVRDDKGNPIENISISFENNGITTGVDGRYTITIPASKEVSVIFSHLTYETFTRMFKVRKGKTVHFSPKLKEITEQLSEVDIKNRTNDAEGITTLSATELKNIPGANAGVENLIMTFAGVNNSNELSTQYNVRGGNFDENLVYVNGIEVYRPFLVRSGQQEGLSFVNACLLYTSDAADE